jgi:hypothetical protein
MRLRLAVCAVGLGLLWSAYGDEFTLTDGTKVAAEIYRETATEILYIDPAKDCCCAVPIKQVKEVKHALEPVVDIKAFLARSAKKISAQQKADLEKYLELLREHRKLKNTKVVVHDNEDAPELVVDPFPEEDQAPAKDKKEPKQKPNKSDKKDKKSGAPAKDKDNDNPPAEEGN